MRSDPRLAPAPGRRSAPHRLTCALAVSAAALLSLAAPRPARAAPPLGITVSGAVSLGWYEAGLL